MERYAYIRVSTKEQNVDRQLLAYVAQTEREFILKNITIRTSTLTSRDVGAKAFSGTYKKPTVKVPAKSLKEYKKLFKAKGMSAKSVYKK